jgi:hypothetical protein
MEAWRITMSIGKTLLVVGIVLGVAAVLNGHRWWFFAVEAFLRLAAVALTSGTAA